MKIITFKKQKTRQFSYKPIYFDPEKEERDALNAMRESANNKKYVPGSIIKGVRLDRYRSCRDINSRKMDQDARNRIILRLIIFLILLFLVGYIIMNNTMLEAMLKVFSKNL